MLVNEEEKCVFLHLYDLERATYIAGPGVVRLITKIKASSVLKGQQVNETIKRFRAMGEL